MKGDCTGSECNQEFNNKLEHDIVEDTKAVLSSLSSWAVRHIRREANQVAHNLAKQAISLVSVVIDIEDVPTCVQSLIMVECI